MANKYPVIAGGNTNAAGTWTLNADGTTNATTVPSASDDVFFNATSGNVTINAAFATRAFDATGYTGVLTHNAFTWTASGSVKFVAGMTYTPLATSTIAFASTGTVTTAGLLLPLITITGGTITMGDNWTTMASKVITLTISSGPVFNLNGKTLAGNSATNRLLIRSNTIGTARTITNTTGTFANADFRDITLSTAADLSAITGLSGDCGGNTNITFTTGVTQTATGNSANWSTTTWTSRVPLPQDDVVLSLTAGQTLTGDMPRLGKDLSVTTNMTFTKAVDVTLYGSMTLISGMTWTNASFRENFEGAGTHTITSAGKGHNRATISPRSGATYTLQDGFSSSSETLSITGAGTFDANDFNVTGFQISFGSVTVNAGNGTWSTARATSGNWSMGASTVFNAEGSTINITGQNSFLGAGKTYNIVSFGATSGAITGDNTFNTFIITSGAKTVTFTAGSTQTSETWTISGSIGALHTINSSSATDATLVKSGGGTVLLDYMSITDIDVTPDNTWYYGDNSTYVSDTGWNAGAPVSGNKKMMLMGIG